MKLAPTTKADGARKIKIGIMVKVLQQRRKKFSLKFQRPKLDLTAKAILSWIEGVSCGKRPTKAMTFLKNKRKFSGASLSLQLDDSIHYIFLF